jgi:hypothetical protein
MVALSVQSQNDGICLAHMTEIVLCIVDLAHDGASHEFGLRR